MKPMIKKSLCLALSSLMMISTSVIAQPEAIPPATSGVNTTAMPTTGTTTIDASSSSLEVNDPLTLAASWIQDAKNAGALPKYSVVGTMKNSHPSLKLVVMGQLTPEGYSFRLNENSNTSQEINAIPNATVLLTWSDKSGGDLQKEIKMYGSVTPQGPTETHSVMVNGKSMEYKTRVYLLKPTGMQLAIINSGVSADGGVVEYVNYVNQNGSWTKMPANVMGFDLAQ